MSAPIDPYAMYVYCDGAMDYTRGNPGGIGFNMTFPESSGIGPIHVSRGVYEGANIERLELEALVKAIEEATNVWQKYHDKLQSVTRIIFVTDRYGLRDEDKTSPYRIREWRRNRWRTNDGKPIKNHKLLDRLDKMRMKLATVSRRRVEIEFRRRKHNKVANKLARAGKSAGVVNRALAKPGEKIGRRKYDGPEIVYKKISVGSILHLNIYRKDPVQDEWEVWGELCDGPQKGCKVKIYAGDALASELKRGNEYRLTVESVFRYYVRIKKPVERIQKSSFPEH